MQYYLKPSSEGSLLDFDPLNLNEMSGVFYLWAIGLLISLLVFLGELIVFHIKNRGCRNYQLVRENGFLKKKPAEISAAVSAESP